MNDLAAIARAERERVVFTRRLSAFIYLVAVVVWWFVWPPFSLLMVAGLAVFWTVRVAVG